MNGNSFTSDVEEHIESTIVIVLHNTVEDWMNSWWSLSDSCSWWKEPAVTKFSLFGSSHLDTVWAKERWLVYTRGLIDASVFTWSNPLELVGWTPAFRSLVSMDLTLLSSLHIPPEHGVVGWEGWIFILTVREIAHHVWGPNEVGVVSTPHSVPTGRASLSSNELGIISQEWLLDHFSWWWSSSFCSSKKKSGSSTDTSNSKRCCKFLEVVGLFSFLNCLEVIVRHGILWIS